MGKFGHIDLATEVTETWERPDAGTWMLDSSHFSPNASRIARDIMERGSVVGFERGFTRFGAPVRTLAMRFVNGRLYTTLVPVFGAGRDMPEPPLPILKAVLRLHPEFRRRNRDAQAALDKRFAMQDFARWEAELKPDLIAQNTAFAQVDVAGLSDAQLGAHIRRLHTHLVESLALHMELHVSDLGPIGLMLLRGAELGLGSVELMAALTGSSPATVGPDAAMHTLREMVSAAPDVPQSLAEVRALSPAAAGELDRVLDVYGDRLTTGYDLQDPTLRELPHIVLAGLTRRDDGRVDGDAARTGAERCREVLQSLTATESEEMQALIDDARALYGLRDENGPLTWQWPMGIMRVAVLEARRRLMGAGKLATPEGVFDLQAAEIADLLGGSSVPGVEEITRRTRNRETWMTMSPPDHLGPDPVEPPLAALPEAMRRNMEVIMLVQGLLDGPDATRVTPVVAGDASARLSGTGIGDTPYTGRARVVVDADEGLARMEAGDVLITSFTVPTFNAVLAIAGAVVVEHGGLLCHAAVIAREFGIAGVVGVAGATSDVPDGAMVEVDPVQGTVTVL